jgi:pimeloyl-ACP methyl ester carboxylesterase
VDEVDSEAVDRRGELRYCVQSPRHPIHLGPPTDPVAQGGDWGAPVSIALASAIPSTSPGSRSPTRSPRPGTPEPTAEERADLDDLKHFRAEEMGYSTQQATRPQTVAYGLTDSPAAQCAWIVEKFCAGSLNATAGSSARLYWESFGSAFAAVGEIATPTAYVAYRREIFRLPERLARTRFTDLRSYKRVERGGHFAALEVPDIFLAEVRAGVRALGVR